jgi:hypothetical protein
LWFRDCISLCQMWPFFCISVDSDQCTLYSEHTSIQLINMAAECAIYVAHRLATPQPSIGLPFVTVFASPFRRAFGCIRLPLRKVVGSRSAVEHLDPLRQSTWLQFHKAFHFP